MSSETRPHAVPPLLSRLAAFALLSAALVAVCGVAASAAPSAEPASTTGSCAYTPTPDQPAARPVSLPPDPKRTPDHGTVRFALMTPGSDRADARSERAPCTVQSFLSLARQKFFDGTPAIG